MKAKYVLGGGGVVLAIAVAVLLAIPGTRYFSLGLLRGDSIQNGRFMSQWAADLQSEDEKKRWEATQELGNLMEKAKDAAPELARLMLEDPESAIRCNAAFALYKIGPDCRVVVPQLTQALSDPDPLVRLNATMALGKAGADAQSAVPALMEAVENPVNRRSMERFSFTIRERMIADLGDIGPGAKQSVPLLEKLLKDDSVDVRKVVVVALGKIGPDAKSAVPTLLEMFYEDDSDAVQDYALKAIQAIDPAEYAKIPEGDR